MLSCSSSLICALLPVVLPESYCPAAPKNCPLTHLQYCHNGHSELASSVLKEQPPHKSTVPREKEMSDSQKMVCIRSNSVIFLRASKRHYQETGTVVVSDVMISKRVQYQSNPVSQRRNISWLQRSITNQVDHKISQLAILPSATSRFCVFQQKGWCICSWMHR